MGLKGNPYWRLMRFDRPIGILLLLWPTWWALMMAGGGHPSRANIIIFTVGVVLMRAAGCVMNDIADRDLDPHVGRTRERPMATGEVGLKQAILVFIALMTLAFLLVLLTNALTIKLAFAGAALAATYPFFKRFTHWPQVVLGLAFGWGIPMAFSAQAGQVPAVAWWLLGINVVWSVIYDTLYAMVDREDDLAIGVKSTAILFGGHDLPIVGALMLVMVVMLAAVGFALGFHWPWHIGVVLVGLLFARQMYSVRDRSPEACFKAFLGNNTVGLVIFASLAAHYLIDGSLYIS